MKTLSALFIVIPLTICFGQTPRVSETVELDGISTYYEAYGDGEPLFLLHGYTMSSQSWKPFISDFNKAYSVYVVDLFGHGKSSPLEGPMNIKSAADNFLSLVNYLGLKEIKAIGFSFGGRVLLQTAIKDPDRIESMVLIGSSYKNPSPDWDKVLTPQWRAYMSNIHIHGEDQIAALMKQSEKVVTTKEMLAKISTNTLLVFGEIDEIVDLDTTINLYKMLPNSHLWVVPNKPHLTYTGDSKPEFVRIAAEFLAGEWQK